jgi:hypothetical protein
MTAPKPESTLTELAAFFQVYGTERLDGLDESYFVGLNTQEKEEAWKFLKAGFWSSSERIKGLYILDPCRAVDLFKETLAQPMADSPYLSARKEIESSYLMMLEYVCETEPDKDHIESMALFAKSQVEDVRVQFAQNVPAQNTTPNVTDALKTMIFTETESTPRSSAIRKLMAIHGIDFKLDDPLYKSTFLSLWMGSSSEKLAAIKKLEAMGKADYI